MLLRNTVKFAHAALSLVPKTLYTVDVISLVCKKLGMIDTEVLEGRDIQYVVAPPAVRIDNAVRHNLTLNDGV